MNWTGEREPERADEPSLPGRMQVQINLVDEDNPSISSRGTRPPASLHTCPTRSAIHAMVDW